MSLSILYKFLNEAQEKGCFSLYSAYLIYNATNVLSKGCTEKQIKSCIQVYSEACNIAQISGKMELSLGESFKIYVLLNRLLDEKQNELKLKKEADKGKKEADELPTRAKQEKEKIIKETINKKNKLIEQYSTKN